MGQGKPGSGRPRNLRARAGGHAGGLADSAPDTPDIEEKRILAGKSAHSQQGTAKGSDTGETNTITGSGSTDFTRFLTGETTKSVEARKGDTRGPAMGVWAHLELIAKVGEGGFGETFRARDTHLDREVALKLLRVEASQQEALGGQVIREGALLARMRHPNVVSVYGAQRHDGRVGLWMEYIHGRTLESQLTEQGPLGEREAALVGIDLCRALAAVHGAGIIHRDIKAANVMREDGGRIVLMDFGLGLDLKAEEAGTAGSMAGTPFYMAPEQLRGEPATVRSDIYSVGVLLYRLVTGRYPLTGRTLADLCKGHDAGHAVRLRDVPLKERARRRAPVIKETSAVDPAGGGDQGTARLDEQFVCVVERCLSGALREREGARAGPCCCRGRPHGVPQGPHRGVEPAPVQA